VREAYHGGGGCVTGFGRKRVLSPQRNNGFPASAEHGMV
jgi:hypothetical protein